MSHFFPAHYSPAMESRAIQTLLGSAIDYASLFPPAQLTLSAAAEAFTRALTGPRSWLLGRFVCPATKLPDLSRAAAALMPGTHATSGYREHADVSEPWRLSVLVDSAADLETIDAFNDHHSREDHGLAFADAVELKPADLAQLDAMLDQVPEDFFAFFELPPPDRLPGQDPRGFVAALADSGAAAKLRTGGITADAFPTPEFVAAFLSACRAAEIPFKATAGLHHPVRGTHALTYEHNAPTCTMHGFLNLFLASALLHSGKIDQPQTAALLADTTLASPANPVVATDVGLTWRKHILDITDLARAREVFCLSFGSCSFDEPEAELKSLDLI